MGTNYPKPNVGPAWAETANNPADIIPLDPSFVSSGWPLTGTPPSRQRFNSILNFLTVSVRYFMQRGLPDYDAAETYRTGSSIIGDDGNTYRSLVDNNIGNTPSSTPSKWTQWALTLAQVNAATLTQATQMTGTNNTTVANTGFVQNAINALSAVLNATITATANGLNTLITAAQNAANTALANAAAAQTTANAANTTANTALAEVTGVIAAFASSLGNSGYQNFEGGLILQWGQTGEIGGGSATVNFPTPFPSACFACVGTTLSNGAAGFAYLTALSRTQATIHNDGSQGNVLWIAVGN